MGLINQLFDSMAAKQFRLQHVCEELSPFQVGLFTPCTMSLEEMARLALQSRKNHVVPKIVLS